MHFLLHCRKFRQIRYPKGAGTKIHKCLVGVCTVTTWILPNKELVKIHKVQDLYVLQFKTLENLFFTYQAYMLHSFESTLSTKSNN